MKVNPDDVTFLINTKTPAKKNRVTTAAS